MTGTHDYLLPYHLDQVWNTLPSAVHHSKKASGTGAPAPGGYRYTFSTGMTLRTFGFSVFVDLHPHPQGTHMRVSTTMNFGLIDWGEGRSIANELHLHLTNLLQMQSGQGQGQGW